jgi:hypothetical protein
MTTKGDGKGDRNSGGKGRDYGIGTGNGTRNGVAGSWESLPLRA